MIIRVIAFANFRDILGKDLNVNLENGSKVKDLLENLCTTHQKLKSEIFDESGNVREYVILLKKNLNK